MEEENKSPGVTTEEENKNREENALPVDKGWSWAILLGASLEMMVVIGMLKTSGIFFVEFQNKFKSTSAMTSLISTVHNGVYSVFALLVTTIGLHNITCRTSIFIGSIISCTAYIITSRADTIELVMFSHGILQGIGMSFMQPCVLIMVGKYFNKRRGFANSLAVSGGSIGALVFAPILTALFENYGFSGAFLIASSFFLQNCIVGALFRPPEFYTNRKRSYKPLSLQNNGIEMETLCSNEKEDNKTTDSLETINSSKANGSTANGFISKSANCRSFEADPGNEQTQELLEKHNHHDSGIRPRTHTNKEVLLDRVNKSPAAMYASSELLASSLLTIDDKSASEDYSRDTTCFTRGLKTVISIFDFQLFKRPVFIVFIIAAGQMCASSALLGVYIAPHVKEMGVPLKQTAVLLTIIAAIDFVSRVVVGILADRRLLRTSTIIGIAGVTMGIISNLLRFFQGYSAFVFFAVCIGLFAGIYFSLFAVVIVDYLTVDKLQNCLGFTTLFHGVSVAVSFAIIGAIRDSTGSYIAPFHFMGVQMLFASTLMLLLPLAEKFEKSSAKDSDLQI